MIVGDLVRAPDGRIGRIRKLQRQTRGRSRLLAWVELSPGERTCIAVDDLVHVPATPQPSEETKGK